MIDKQRFEGEDLEIEKFVNVRICMRCYSFAHVTKKCHKDRSYTVCSECSEGGHRFKECQNSTKKCLNCHGPHKTLALKCPERKKKIKEI